MTRHKIYQNLRAVIDIGSNSVRLVVFEDDQQFKRIVHESEACGLGRGLSMTGVLHPHGKAEAILLLQRFAAVLRQHGVPKKQTYVIATEAVRRAKDGKNFLQTVQRRTGLKIKIISGDQEGFLSAYGVACGFPNPRGVVGDMGGGSFELVAVDDDKIGQRISLPFGPLPLLDSKDSLALIRKKVRKEFKRLAWLKDAGQGQTFYAVGGIFRSLARIYKTEHQDPLDSVHGFAITRQDLEIYLRRNKSKLWARIAEAAKIRQDRIDKFPVVLAVLAELCDYVGFAQIRFSEYGLREGLLARKRNLKPKPELLVSACQSIARRYKRTIAAGPPMLAKDVFDFIHPVRIAVKATSQQNLLILAACAFSDIGWAMHKPDRALGLLREIAEEPIPQATQRDRLFIALMIFVRYGGKMADVPYDLSPMTSQEKQLVDTIGHALRLADTLCLGASSILQDLDLRANSKVLTLDVPQRMPVGGGGDVPSRLEKLAEILGVKALLVQKSRRH